MDHRLLLGFSAMALLSTRYAAAQTSPRPESEFEQLPVVVTSSRIAPSKDETAFSVSLINRSDVEGAPATTLDELLRGIPNVQLPLSNQNAGFPTAPSIAIRGLGLGDNGTRTLVLIDGVPANGGFFGNVFWNRVPLNNVERVEVVRGGGSGVHGAYALGGVVNIVTEQPAREKANLTAQAHAGSFDRYGAQASVSSSLISGRAQGSLSLGYEESDGFFEVIPEQRGPIDTRTSFENINARANLKFDITDTVQLTVQGGAYDQDQGGTSISASTSTEVQDISLALTANLGAGQIVSRLYFQDEDFQTFNVRSDRARTREFVTFTSSSGSEDIGGSIAYIHDFDTWLKSVAFGLDGRLVDGDNSAITFTPEAEVAFTEDNTGEQRSVGIFAEATLSLFEGNEVILNAREDIFWNGDATRNISGFSIDVEPNEIDEFSFRVAVSQQLSPEWSAQAATYRAFRTPTLAELYRSFGSNTFIGLANPQLEAETLFGGEFGLRFEPTLGSFLELNAFQSRVSNFIGGVPASFFPIFTLENTNLGRIKSRGIEAIGEKRLNEHFSVNLGYTFLDSEVSRNEPEPRLIGNRTEGAPKHTIHGGFSVSDWNGFDLNLRGRYLSRQFQDIGNETELSSHIVFDAGASYDLRPGANIFIKGENIFDETYEASAFGGLIQRGSPATVSLGLRLALGPR